MWQAAVTPSVALVGAAHRSQDALLLPLEQRLDVLPFQEEYVAVANDASPSFVSQQ